ncbi:MAG TPA: transposase [Armatimonadota bacterium]|jgi:hypothetical protein
MEMHAADFVPWRRRSIRLRGYDYRTPDAYSVTVCTADRLCLLAQAGSGVITLSELGDIAAAAWLDLPRHFPNVELDAFVIMPNHVHGIVCFESAVPDPDGTEARRFGDVVAGSLSAVVGAFKSASARCINGARGTEGAAVWQRGFHERVIRPDRMLEAIRLCIANNPANWARDAEHVNE